MTESPEKIVAIVQPNYIPWKGYFDIIRSVDEFILLDDVQYTHDWRNRNLLKTKDGLKWLTIPVNASREQHIKDIKAIDNGWRRKHWNIISDNYAKATYFEVFRERLKELFLNHDEIFISRIDYDFLTEINLWFGITTPLTWSSEYNTGGKKDEKILNLCKKARATGYLSGPAAKAYLRENIFTESDVKVHWMDYSNYPEYHQLFPPFEHGVSILDLILNEGPHALQYMKQVKIK